jgi:hypothetical protein
MPDRRTDNDQGDQTPLELRRFFLRVLVGVAVSILKSGDAFPASAIDCDTATAGSDTSVNSTSSSSCWSALLFLILVDGVVGNSGTSSEV